jgi:hypothetical protein
VDFIHEVIFDQFIDGDFLQQADVVDAKNSNGFLGDDLLRILGIQMQPYKGKKYNKGLFHT